ncbi:Clp protease N-terminal domain-containing protein [Kitasatospora sp. NBC_01266]|uniref:Clp protease N-terminal domain-containing protein n=1 Tax=Kitasatospora sp. NBC_01266 TaxID=2903572 RepID=UPI002E37D9AE|nr:Clp protease N-terminal domain-containing protein [Kitasatospora sp. NBC_01266]
MFERFTAPTRQAITEAQREAAQLRHEFLGTEHLLLGLLHHPEDPCVAVLVDHGLDLPSARAAVVRLLGDGSATVDAEALGSIGIDLTAVREAVEATFGPGALDGRSGGPSSGRSGGRDSARRVRFSHRAKQAIALGLSAAVARKAKTIEPGHLLVGLLQEAQQPPSLGQRQGLAARVLQDRGLVLATVHPAVLAALDH